MKCVSRYVVLVVIILLASPAALAPTYAQQGGQVQELTGKVEQGRFQFYLLPDLKQGQILYVYASGTSGNLDPIAGLIDTNRDFQAAAAEYDAELEQIIAEGRDPLLAADELRDRFLLVWDDDSGGGLVAAFQFRVPRDGDYRLALTGSLSYQAEDTFGHYRLLLGLDAPEVLTGEVELSGDVIAEAFGNERRGGARRPNRQLLGLDLSFRIHNTLGDRSMDLLLIIRHQRRI